MRRFDNLLPHSSGHGLQVALVLFLLMCLFTASIGGIRAQIISPLPEEGGRGQAAAPTIDAAAKKTKTPDPSKTRKPKKTKTPSATATGDVSPTRLYTETPTPTGTATLAAAFTPTRKSKKTRTPTPIATSSAPATCADGSAAISTADIEMSASVTLQTPDCQISIRFAPNTFSEPLTARLRYTPKNPGIQQVINRFELRFFDAAGKHIKRVKLKQPATIQLQYDPRALGALKENILDLVYWDKQAKSWIPLYSKLDMQAHTLTVETTQLAPLAGISGLEDLQPYLPSLQGFQTDLFSGAATANYPLIVPLGQGGLAPKLNLSYSSSAADNFDSNTQASYVGVGWSLGTGYIIRHERNYNDNNQDKQLHFFSLVLEGASYDLVPENSTTYHTANETYWSITNDNTDAVNPDPSKWTIVTNDGTTYIFGDGGNFRANWYRRNPVNQGVSSSPQNYLWVLKNVTDVHGNQIKYTYLKETATCPVNSGTYTTALYPDTISYNYSGTTPLSVIDFEYVTRTDQAIHFPTTQCGVAPHMKLALEHVYVKTATSTNNASNPPTARQYNFSYNNGTSNSVVFTGIPYTNTNTTNPPRGALGLTHFWQQDPDNESVQLNEGIFDYGASTSNTQANHLTTIENGIEGQVTFAYTTSQYGGFNLPAADNWSTIYDTRFICTSTACDWKGNNASVGIATNCSGGTQSNKALLVQPNSGGGFASYRVYPFAPGGQYSIDVKVEGANASSSVYVGVSRDIDSPGTEFTSSSSATVTNCNNTDFSVGGSTGFALPPHASVLQINVHTTGNIRVKQVTVRKVGVYPHVVASRALDDGRGNVKTYSYNYGFADNLAVNDENTSTVILSKGCYPNNPGGPPSTCVYLRQPYGTEFRGFNKVIVTDPKNNTITHRFKQDDLYKGREYKVVEESDTGVKYRMTESTFDSDQTLAVNVNGDQSNFTFVSNSTVTLYNPDAANNAVARTQFTEYEYNTSCANGNLCKVIEHGDKTTTPGGPYFRYTTFAYANLGNHILGKPQEQKVYDANNQLISRTVNMYGGTSGCDASKGDLSRVDAYSSSTAFSTTQFECNADGAYTKIIDPLGNPTTTTYDTLYTIFPVTVTNAKSQSVTTSYNYKLGLPKNITDFNGGVTKITYDVFGRKSQIWNPIDNLTNQVNATTIITYNLTASPANIQVQSRNDAGGTTAPVYLKQWYFFDGLGRIIQQQTRADVNGNTDPIIVDTNYSDLGMPFKTTNPYSVAGSSGTYQTPNPNNPGTKVSYDMLGRLTKTTNPDSTERTISYGLVNNKWTTTLTDEKNHVKQSQTDGLNRTTAVIELINSAPYTTQYGYDALDRLTSVTDSANHQTMMQYDWLGRKLDMQDPDMGHWVYGYDAAGNLKRQTDAKNNSLCFNYDPLNRATQKQARTGNDCNAGSILYTVTFGFDDTANGNKGIGQRTSMSDPSGSSAWTYDALGRMIKEIKTINGAPQSYTTQWAYGDAGQLTQMIYPVDNETVCTTYNKQLLPKTLTSAACGSSGANYVNSAVYNAAGQTLSLTLGNNLVTTSTYDTNLRLSTLKTGPSNSIQNLTYTYEANGNVATITDALRGETSAFGYDDLDRLTSATITGGTSPYTQNWQYTPLGNIAWRKDNGAQTNYAYADTNHIHAATSMGATNYSYDPNGNMLTRGTDSLQYDVENRLTSITVGATTTTSVYDGDGKRVKKSVGSTTTYYVGNYYEVTNGAATKYYYFGGKRVALKNASGVTYLHSDHLGGTSVTTNSSGTCTSTQFYQPYGNIRSVSAPAPCGGTPSTDFGFTGQRRDASAGLMYYGARFYDAGLGRFVSADTIIPQASNPQSLNRYSYTLNNPIKYTDPDGHCVPVCTALIGASVGALIGYGTQVYANMQSGQDFGSALTTNIDGSKIIGGALLGAAVGSGVGLVAGATGVGVTATMVGRAACADGDCTNEARTMGHTVASTHRTLTTANSYGGFGEWFNASRIAQGVQTAPNAGVTVLGRVGEAAKGIPDYRAVASQTGANSLSVPNELWGAITRTQQWAVNQSFLDLAIKRGDRFRLSYSYDAQMLFTRQQLRGGRFLEDLPFFSRELLYLESQGYSRVRQFVDGQWLDFMQR